MVSYLTPKKNPLWRSWQCCTAVLRCFFWESRISIKGRNNNVLYWFNVEDNSDSCFFSFFFLWYCFLVDPFHLSTVSTFFHCEPRLGLNHMGSEVPVLISACFWKHQLTWWKLIKLQLVNALAGLASQLSTFQGCKPHCLLVDTGDTVHVYQVSMGKKKY